MIITTEQKKDISGDPYNEYTAPLDNGSLSFSISKERHPDDVPFVLFTLNINDMDTKIEASFGFDIYEIAELITTMLTELSGRKK